MGNKICFHPRIILTEEIALHFKSSNLTRDVIPIINKWRAEGAELCFDLREFEQTFDVVVDTERQFNVFDTDRNGRVDAHEVLMVYILLSTGDIDKKIQTVLSTYDFFSKKGASTTINFDEAMIIFDACVKGLQKVCQQNMEIPDDEIFYHCKSMFDMHHLPHTGRISYAQFTDWTMGDPSPRAFVNLFHNSKGLPDVYSQVQENNLKQGRVFQMLARGQLHVSADSLRNSKEFIHVLQDASDDEVDALLDLMLIESTDGRISTDRFHTVLRPWNIFNECDFDHSHHLDDKEVSILLWIHLRLRPTQKLVHEFIKLMDVDSDGTISRKEWVQALMDDETKRRAMQISEEHTPKAKDQTDQLSRSRSKSKNISLNAPHTRYSASSDIF